MAGPFKLRSGNTTPFKQMGSSPVKGIGNIFGRKKIYNPETNTTDVYNRKGKLIKTKYHGDGKTKPTKPEGTKVEPIKIDNKNELNQNINITDPNKKDDESGNGIDVKPQPPKSRPIRPPKKPKPPKKEKPAPPEKKRDTSWWRGEEGWIPDELQPHVNRPKVKDEGKSIFESLKEKFKKSR